MKAMNVLYLMIMFNVTSIIFQTVGVWTGTLVSGDIVSFFTYSLVALSITGGLSLGGAIIAGPEYTSAIAFYGFFTALWNINTVMIGMWTNEVSFAWLFNLLLFGLGQLFGVVGAIQVMSGGWQSHV